MHEDACDGRPNLHECGTVLGAVKTKPFGWPPTAADPDSSCARRPAATAGRDEGTALWDEQKKLHRQGR